MKFLKNVYEQNLFTILIYFLLSFGIIFYYRIETYQLIKSIYLDLNQLTFINYLRLSFYQDSAFLIFFNLLLCAFLVLFHKLSKTKHFITGFSFVYLSLFMILSIQFFKVYETAFQKSYITDENLTGISNNLKSLSAELTFVFWIKCIVFTFMIIGAVYLIKRFSRFFLKPKGLMLIFPVLVYFLLILGFIFKPSPASGLLREFSINPAYHFLFESKSKPEGITLSASQKRNDWQERFNANSLEVSTKYPKNLTIPRGKKYNIIFYSFESTAYQYLKMKINGRYVMENWNKLEKNSLHFKNHYANYPLSANALFTILTSAYDSNEKDPVLSKHPKIPLKTMPEILSENGYRNYLIHTGFLEYAGQIHFVKNRKFDQILEYKDLIQLPGWGYDVGWGADERVMTEPAVKLLKEKPQQPFFILFLPVNPHHPYAIPDKSFQITGEIPKNMDQKQKIWMNYVNSLHYADAALGELIDRLEKEGLMKNTLLFVFADHGEAFYQHRMNYNHPFFLYEENVHVPFLIYSKEFFKETQYFEGITRHIDLLPTVLDLIGLKKEPALEGISVLTSRKEQMAVLHASWKDDYTAIRDSKWKYIHQTKTGAEELYDLNADPAEKNNRVNDYPEISKNYLEKVKSVRLYKNDFFKKLTGKKKRDD